MKACPYCLADIPAAARKCKHCGEWVEPRGPADGGGRDGLRVTVAPPTRGPTKPCPYCAAQIPAAAWACLYCKRGVLGGRPVAVALAVLAALVVLFGVVLPGWLGMREKHRELEERHRQFERDWERRQRVPADVRP